MTNDELFASASEMAAGAGYGDNYLTGDYSYLANAQRMSPNFNLYDEVQATDSTGSGNLDDDIVANAVAGTWLPLCLPPGADGYRSDGKPTGFFYAVTQNSVVTGRLDQAEENARNPQVVGVAPAGDDEVKEIRFHEAASLGLISATYTSGSPYVRES